MRTLLILCAGLLIGAPAALHAETRDACTGRCTVVHADCLQDTKRTADQCDVEHHQCEARCPKT